MEFEAQRGAETLAQLRTYRNHTIKTNKDCQLISPQAHPSLTALVTPELINVFWELLNNIDISWHMSNILTGTVQLQARPVRTNVQKRAFAWYRDHSTSNRVELKMMYMYANGSRWTMKWTESL